MKQAMTKTTADAALRERAIEAAVIEMSLAGGTLEMKVRKTIDRYEWVLRCGREGITHD